MPELLSHLSDEDFNVLRRQIAGVDIERAREREDTERLKQWLGDILSSDPAYFRAILGIKTEEDHAADATRADDFEEWKLNHMRRRRMERESRNA